MGSAAALQPHKPGHCYKVHQVELNFTTARFSALSCCLTSISSNFMLFGALIEIKFLSLHLASFGS